MISRWWWLEGSRKRLLLRREVPLARTNLQVFLQRRNLDGAIPPIGIEIGRLVGNHILAAEFVFNCGERVRNVFHLEGKESAPAGGLGQLLKHLVTPHDQSAVVG